ncbi:unnamed protein product [Lymnaea stagnalis]|uniref:Smr domain-containing protein n=1 Tax=Lymnaea stagnalis TaxID=6523 RepID=A0AAV2HWL9_LYMST
MDLLLAGLFVLVVILTAWLIYNRSSIAPPPPPTAPQSAGSQRDNAVHKDVFCRRSEDSPSLDLHGASVQGAKRRVVKFLQERSDVYFNGGMRLLDRYVYIVTGPGGHSELDRASIHEDMISYLAENGYSYKWRNPDEAEVDLLSSENS